MQAPIPLPPDVPPGAFDFLADLIDAKWVVTTMLALYAALLSTFQTFIKDWWIYRPRIKVGLAHGMTVPHGVETFNINIVNNGYKERRISETISLQVKELQALAGQKKTMLVCTNVMFARPMPPLLAASDSVLGLAPKEDLYPALRHFGIHRREVSVRASVSDGTNKVFFSNWIKVDLP